MNRRDAVRVAAVMTSLGLSGLAESRKTFRVGVLSSSVPPENLFLGLALREYGHEENDNIVFDYRFAHGRDDRLVGMAEDLAASKVDLIVAVSNPEILAAKRATSTIPIVMVLALTPVESGLVSSFARPGGNVTGTTLEDPESAGKKLEVLRDAVPRVSRVALLWEPAFPGMDAYGHAARRAADAMGIELTFLRVGNPAELEEAFDSIDRRRPDALYVVPAGAVFTQRARIIEFAAHRRLPALYTTTQPVIEGGLLSYSADLRAVVRRTAAIIDRLLRGTKPVDIPVEQPTRYELVINLHTAKALGMTIPPSLLARADRVIGSMAMPSSGAGRVR
jgi:putative ABC transport system substrate-binding protein